MRTMRNEEFSSPVICNGFGEESQGLEDNNGNIEVFSKDPYNLPPMPPGLQPLKHQLAGHKFGDRKHTCGYGILDCGDGTILKPVMTTSSKGQRERYFYDIVNGGTTPNPYFDVASYEPDIFRKLKRFTPVFKGFVSLPEHPDVVYIKMVDATHSFLRSHVMDIKIGAQAWEPYASEAKINRQKSRCKYLSEICFQVVGAKYYSIKTGEETFKLDLRTYNPHDLLHSGLYEIFAGVVAGARSVLLELILADLQEFADWFASQRTLSFRGSGVLIAFETDEQKLNSCLQHGKSAFRDMLQVKLIDFVHVWETDSLDSNYIEGLSSVIKYFTALSELFNIS
ncbi:inositol polyphosphate multikinase-like [Watersipora subatra]|uniref:inositol polyphosphate multikinase-like n=1 Tax=Watersipora subatra TaxID=2589382 RepID=UPI00355B4B39